MLLGVTRQGSAAMEAGAVSGEAHSDDCPVDAILWRLIVYSADPQEVEQGS